MDTEMIILVGVWGNFILQSVWFFRTKDKH